MKKIAVTQRVECTKVGERRDCIDQKWTRFLMSCQLLPVFVSNDPAYLDAIKNDSSIRGILLTGGNSLASYGGDAPERDKVEKQLIELAIKKKLPLMGVCRGMQMIQSFFGVTLKQIQGHVAARHYLHVTNDSFFSEHIKKFESVNSYHDYGVSQSVDDLIVIARSQDDIIMAVKHKTHHIYGQMWHPERESPFSKVDQQIFKSFFEQGG